jgi:acyl phosphate:glycerol-3-phosphate acyltransferase
MAFIYFFAAYLLGSISSAILICKALGEPDPRSSGSGNPGATNVLRQSGKKAALLTLAGDVAKGFLPVLLGTLLHLSPVTIALLGAGAFIGHLFPIFFQFKGGKGVATLIGVLFGISPMLGFGFAVTWLIVAGITRYSSLAALIAAAASPIIAWALQIPGPIVLSLCALVVLLIWRHRPNIEKLLRGEESKIGQKNKTAQQESTIDTTSK